MSILDNIYIIGRAEELGKKTVTLSSQIYDKKQISNHGIILFYTSSVQTMSKEKRSNYL